MQSRPDLSNWDGQSPPKGTVPAGRRHIGSGLPRFGPYELKRQRLVVEDSQKRDLLAVEPEPVPQPAAKAPSIADQIGRALSRIGNYNDLDNKVYVSQTLLNNVSNKSSLWSMKNYALIVANAVCLLLFLFPDFPQTWHVMILVTKRSNSTQRLISLLLPTTALDALSVSLSAQSLVLPSRAALIWATDCITMVPRKIPYVPIRGLPVKA